MLFRRNTVVFLQHPLEQRASRADAPDVRTIAEEGGHEGTPPRATLAALLGGQALRGATAAREGGGEEVKLCHGVAPYGEWR